LSKKVDRQKCRLIEQILHGSRNVRPDDLLKVAEWIGLRIRKGNGDEKIVYTDKREELPMRVDRGQKQLLPKYLSRFKHKFEPEIESFKKKYCQKTS
jgi:hypothetical protein